MPTVDQIAALAAAAGAALFAVAKVAVPLGLLGSLIELFGERFELPRVQRFGEKMRRFFTDVPGLFRK